LHENGLPFNPDRIAEQSPGRVRLFGIVEDHAGKIGPPYYPAIPHIELRIMHRTGESGAVECPLRQVGFEMGAKQLCGIELTVYSRKKDSGVTGHYLPHGPVEKFRGICYRDKLTRDL
jgi:hypothetical protein